jgi:hypothetical protein
MYRKISSILIPTLLAVGIIAYMLYTVWGSLITALQRAMPAYLLLAVMICITSWWLRGWRYHFILEGLNYSVGIIESTACVCISQTANLIVPARLGDFVRAFILKHEYQTTYSEGVSSIVVERIFDIVIVAFLGAVSLFFVLNVPAWFYTIIVIPLLAGIFFFVFLLFIGKLTSKNRYIAIIYTLLDEIRRASLSVKAIVVLSATSIVIWLLDSMVTVAIVMMFQEHISFAVIVLAIVVGNLVKAVPLTPGGIGTYELALAITFEIAGVAPAIATLIAVIDHLVKNLVTLGGGIISIYFFGDWVIPTIKTAIDSKLSKRKDA